VPTRTIARSSSNIDAAAERDTARWRPRACVICWAELIGVCVNQACAACCPYVEAEPTGRVCFIHGVFRDAHLHNSTAGISAIEMTRDPIVAITNRDVEQEAGRIVQALDSQQHYNASLDVFICVCGSQWPNHKCFSGHCGQCDLWKKRDEGARNRPRRREYRVMPPFDGREGQDELFDLYSFPEPPPPPEWAAIVADYASFPPVNSLLSRNSAQTVASVLSATHLRIYIERFGVRAGPTLAERRRQFVVLAEAGNSVGYATLSLAQPRWICMCGRRFRFEAALARHAVLCDDWEACPKVAGLTAIMIPLTDLTLLCGTRQPVRNVKEFDDLRLGMLGATTTMRSFQASLVESRVASLQAMYCVPIRCALAHITELETNKYVAANARLSLGRMRKRLQPLLDLITSPMTRRNSTVAELDLAEASIRRWITTMLRDPQIIPLIVERASREPF
jgi:hypothetical protein